MLVKLYAEPVEKTGSTVARAPARLVYPGRRYHLNLSEGSLPDGAIADYRLSPAAAELLPLNVAQSSPSGFLYDDLADSAAKAWILDDEASASSAQRYRLATNALTLAEQNLEGPLLRSSGEDALLYLQPHFRLHYAADEYSARLGVVHLVQSQRFLTLDDGEQLPLLETAEPVLYRLCAHGGDAVQPMGPAFYLGERRELRYAFNVSQRIPNQIEGRGVETVTVLEQYRTFFLQRPTGAQPHDTIWIPALAPITWGWSIRVGRRFDGEWDILRRKLVMPTVGHDGLEFPLWESNHLAFVQSDA